MAILRKHLAQLFELWAELVFFHGIPSYLKGQLTSDGYLAFDTWQAFFENEQSDPVISKKTVYNISCQWRILFFKQK